MPGIGIAPPGRAGGIPQRPPVLVPGVPGGPAPIARPMPTVPGVTMPGRTVPGVTLPGRTLPGTLPPRAGGYNPQQPPVLVPGQQPGGPTMPNGRPMPTVPPGMGQYPARTGTPTNGQCGMFNNYGLIGFFDKTVGAAVKRLMGMRDTCIPGYSGVGAPPGSGTMMTPGMTPGAGMVPGAGMTTPGGRVMPQMTPRVFR
ncbi:MAG: hypothetical protein ACAI38_13965 [Myxococcota bacterium]